MDILIDVLTKIVTFIKIFKVRRVLMVVMLTATTLSYLRIRRARKSITQEEEDAFIKETYQKDENGLYPWEVDVDDHPSRVTKESKPMINSWGPKRGKW